MTEPATAISASLQAAYNEQYSEATTEWREIGAKYKVRNYSRCNRCGRPRAVFKKFGLCRICLRELAHQGVIPGMTKSSW